MAGSRPVTACARAAVCAALLLLAPAAADAQCLTPPGDIDADGVTDVVDMQCAILTTLSLQAGPGMPLPGCLKVQAAHADTNCDGTVNVADLIIIAHYAVKVPLNPLLDANTDACPDACEVIGESFVVPAIASGVSKGGKLTLEPLGADLPASGASSGGGLTLVPAGVQILPGE